MTTPQLMQSYEAGQALTVFSQEFDAAYVAAPSDQWSRAFGLTVSGKFRHTIPIPVDAPGFREALGDDPMRSLFHGSLSFQSKEWVDGITELARVLEGPDFSGWGAAPANIAQEAARNPDVLVAAMLEANPLLDLYRVELPGGSVASAVNLFHASHPVNLVDSSFGTQGNVIAQGTYTGFTRALMKAVVEHFAAWKAANGRPQRLSPTHVLCPPGRIVEAREFFARDSIAEVVANVLGTENVAAVLQPNVFRGTITPVQVDELTDADYVYFVCGGAAAKPWVLQDGGAPEQIVFDKDSELYKNKYRVGIKFLLTQGVAAALPGPILRVDLKASSR